MRHLYALALLALALPASASITVHSRWAPGTGEPTGYEVEKSISGGTWEPVGVAPHGAATISGPSFEAEHKQIVRIRVRAVDPVTPRDPTRWIESDPVTIVEPLGEPGKPSIIIIQVP